MFCAKYHAIPVLIILHHDVRGKHHDQMGRVAIERHDPVGRSDEGPDIAQSGCQRVCRSGRSLQFTHAGIGVHCDDQPVSEFHAPGQEVPVPVVEHIEAAVGEDGGHSRLRSVLRSQIAVPICPTLQPAALLARVQISPHEAPAASPSAVIATTMSPAPVTSWTSFASVG